MLKAKRRRELVTTLGEECHTGLKRDENQDSVLHGTTPYGEMFVVSDGVGGYYGGAEASAIVTRGMFRHMNSLGHTAGPEAAVREAIKRVNAEVFAAGQSGDASRRRMSATLAFALLMPQAEQEGFEGFTGNVGDSRVYLLRNRLLTQLSIDHTAVQGMIDTGLLTPDQAINHPQASVLIRTIGQGPDVTISLNRVEVKEHEQLLLCSDGLHAFVSSAAIVDAMTNPQLNASQCSRLLLDLALEAGGPDNISIQVVRVSLADAAAPAKKSRNPLKWASVAAGVILIATLGGVKLYQAWQLRPAALVARALSAAGTLSKSAGGALEDAAKSATTGSESAPLPHPSRSAPTGSGETATSPGLLIGGILPSDETERNWYLNFESRFGAIAEIQEPRTTPCTLLERDKPGAYYRDPNVRQQAPASDTEVRRHYDFHRYSPAVRHACGDFDLLLLPARQQIVVGDVKNRLEAGRDKVKSATQKVTDVLTDH